MEKPTAEREGSGVRGLGTMQERRVFARDAIPLTPAPLPRVQGRGDSVTDRANVAESKMTISPLVFISPPLPRMPICIL